MSITQADVDRVLNEAREFFARGMPGETRKSANKFYDDIDTARHAERNREADAALRALIINRDKFDTGDRLWDGDSLIRAGVTYGNCGEMTKVTSFMCFKDPQLSGKIAQMTAVSSKDRGHGEHEFLLIGDGSVDLKRADLKKIQNFAEIGKDQGAWVLDTWAQIGCHISEYPQRMLEKCQRWHEQGKRITRKGDMVGLDPDGRMILTPNPKAPPSSTREFGTDLQTSPLKCSWITLRSPEQEQTRHQPPTRPRTASPGSSESGHDSDERPAKRPRREGLAEDSTRQSGSKSPQSRTGRRTTPPSREASLSLVRE